ncbi:hypothetical protein FLONG3_2524, partial [Fusarium longipes]
ESSILAEPGSLKTAAALKTSALLNRERLLGVEQELVEAQQDEAALLLFLLIGILLIKELNALKN